MQRIRYQAAKVELALNDQSGSKSEELSLSKFLPSYPRKRTSLDTVGIGSKVPDGGQARTDYASSNLR
jgi:hypothetical protein